MRFPRTTAQLGLLALAALSACGVSEGDVIAASNAASTAILVDDIDKEVKKSKDFDSIAANTVAGMDTSGLEALE